MKLELFRVLIAIEETGSFAQAAARLDVTPSAVSHQMRQLEEALAVRLFDREVRPARLNTHARAVAARAREVLIDFDALVDSAGSPGRAGGLLHLGCVSGISSELIPLALANLRASHPALRVRMEEGLSEGLAGRVRRRKLDAAIITALSEPDTTLNEVSITAETMVVVAPRGAQGDSWEDVLATYPFLRLNRQSGMGILIDQTLRHAGLDVEEAMELDSSEAIVGLAKAGLGAGVVPSGRLRFVSASDVVTVPFGDPPLTRRVVLVERRNSKRADLSQLVCEELRRLTH
jgi:DNA-binding transcriptional LysR family regulator